MEWKTIPGFPRYQASSDGRFRSVGYMNRGKLVNGNLIEPIFQHGGFCWRMNMVNDKGKRTSISPQRAMWITFNGAVPEGYRVFTHDKSVDNWQLDNLFLFTAGRPKRVRKTTVQTMEGFCQSMADVLRMRWV